MDLTAPCPLDKDLMVPTPCDKTSCPVHYRWQDEKGCLSRAMRDLEKPEARLQFLLDRGLTTHALMARQTSIVSAASKDLIALDDADLDHCPQDHCPSCHYPVGHARCSTSLCLERAVAMSTAVGDFIDAVPGTPESFAQRVWNAVIAGRARFLRSEHLERLTPLLSSRHARKAEAVLKHP
jgi:hypothetical protein